MRYVAVRELSCALAAGTGQSAICKEPPELPPLSVPQKTDLSTKSGDGVNSHCLCLSLFHDVRGVRRRRFDVHLSEKIALRRQLGFHGPKSTIAPPASQRTIGHVVPLQLLCLRPLLTGYVGFFGRAFPTSPSSHYSRHVLLRL